MTMLDEEVFDPDLVVSTKMLQGFNRMKTESPLYETINGAYYIQPDGWISFGDGPGTHQSTRLINQKGWRLLPQSPRPDINREMGQPYHALLSVERGVRAFTPEQIVVHGWHRNAPVIMICRKPLDDIDHPEHDSHCFRKPSFPQLRNVQVFEASCNICRKGWATTRGAEVVETWVKKHMEVSHRDNLVNRELTTGLAGALAQIPALTGGGGLSAEMIAQIASVAATAAVQAMLQAQVSLPNLEPTGPVVDELLCGIQVGNGTCQLPAGHGGVHKLHLD